MKADLILIGGGGHCKSCIDVIETTGQFNILGILDDESKVDSELLGYKYIGTDNDIASYQGTNVEFLVTVGQVASPNLRKYLFKMVKDTNNNFATVVSPRAYVSDRSSVGKGTIVMHDALINVGVTIGVNCIINTKALVEHDSTIGAHCHISTAAIINGNVHISEGSFFGSNAVSNHSISSSPGSFIKAGSCFTGNSN